MAQRKFDPEALEEFMTVVQTKLLKPLEDDLQKRMMEGGALNKMPAFGQLEGSPSAVTAYKGFWDGTWTNIEGIRAAYYGMLKTLQDSIDLNEEAEGTNVQEMNQFEGEL